MFRLSSVICLIVLVTKAICMLQYTNATTYPCMNHSNQACARHYLLPEKAVYVLGWLRMDFHLLMILLWRFVAWQTPMNMTMKPRYVPKIWIIHPTVVFGVRALESTPPSKKKFFMESEQPSTKLVPMG